MVGVVGGGGGGGGWGGGWGWVCLFCLWVLCGGFEEWVLGGWGWCVVWGGGGGGGLEELELVLCGFFGVFMQNFLGGVGGGVGGFVQDNSKNWSFEGGCARGTRT